MCAGRDQPVVPGHSLIRLECRDNLEAGRGPAHHGHGHRAVEGRERVRRGEFQQVVEPEDLRPVGVGHRRGLVVDGGDGRLQLVGTDLAARQRPGDECHALGDLRLVPAAPILLVQRDQLPGRPGAGQPPGVGEQHQREQPGDLPVAGQQPADDPGQPDRLGRQVRAEQHGPGGGGVSLGEDQVEDVQDHR